MVAGGGGDGDRDLSLAEVMGVSSVNIGSAGGSGGEEGDPDLDLPRPTVDGCNKKFK